MAGQRVEVDGGIMEGVSAGPEAEGWRQRRGLERAEPPRLTSSLLSPHPHCGCAGRPDPEGLHSPELSLGPPLARAEDPSRPQHAWPEVNRGAGEKGGGTLRGAGGVGGQGAARGGGAWGLAVAAA